MRCGSARALWDVPVYADSIEVRTRKIDTRIVDKEQKRVFAIKMSCPIWFEYREVKEMEKTQKYCLLTNVGIEREKSWLASKTE